MALATSKTMNHPVARQGDRVAENTIACGSDNLRPAAAPRPWFARQLQNVIRDLRVNGLRDASKKQLVSACVEDLQTLKQLQADWQRMRQDNLRLNIQARVDGYNAQAANELIEVKFNELVGRLPQVEFPVVSDVLTARTMVHPPEVIRQDFSAQLARLAAELFAGFDRSLEQEAELPATVGSIEWLSDTECTYDFYRFVLIHHKVGSRVATSYERHEDLANGVWREDEVITKYADQERVERHRKDHHELYDAKRHRLPLQGLDVPSDIAEFLRKLPGWLASEVEVAAGEMVKELIVEKDISTTRWTEREEIRRTINTGRLWSPAVCLGPHVLAGWSDFDLQIDRRFQVQRDNIRREQERRDNEARVQRENARRERERREQEAKISWYYWLASSPRNKTGPVTLDELKRQVSGWWLPGKYVFQDQRQPHRTYRGLELFDAT